jgi:sirohydrochlorin ferrochelatase
MSSGDAKSRRCGVGVPTGGSQDEDISHPWGGEESRNAVNALTADSIRPRSFVHRMPDLPRFTVSAKEPILSSLSPQGFNSMSTSPRPTHATTSTAQVAGAGSGEPHPVQPASEDVTELLWNSLLESLGFRLAEVGVIVVDHGSRRAASNHMLESFADLFQEESPFVIVEPAHMELAEPTIAQAFARCVERGARLVLISPFFLLPGRHWTADIPQLARDAAQPYPEIRWFVSAPLGLHPLLPQVMLERAAQCLRRLQDPSVSCDVCQASGSCQVD